MKNLKTNEMKEIQVTPLNDIKKHIDAGVKCHCKPSVTVVNSSKIVVHNSYDKREVIEGNKLKKLINENKN